MKKSQGLPLTTIVIAVLAILVLVMIGIFTMGGFTRLFGSIATWFGTSSAMTREAAVQECKNYCEILKIGGYNTLEKIRSSAYCTKEFPIDLNNDGEITEDERFNCWELYPCTVTVEGKTITIDESVCTGKIKV